MSNLYLLETQYPGILRDARLFLMGGYVYPPREGYPQWRDEDDFNLQIDARSALCVIEHGTPTYVPLSVTVKTALQRKHLAALRRTGVLGRLLVRQAEAWAEDEKIGAKFGKTCPQLPSDIINFQHDPLCCAIALGWSEGVEISTIPLKTAFKGGLLHQTIDGEGKPTQVVTKIDGERFNQFWVDTIAGVAQA